MMANLNQSKVGLSPPDNAILANQQDSEEREL